jgi:hypothetical protein
MKAQADIRAELAQIRARGSTAAPIPEILCQAALVTHFDPFALSQQHDKNDDDGSGAVMTLMEEAVPLTAPEGAWTLPLETRRRIVAGFPDRAAVLKCLATISDRPENRTQAAFERLMSDPGAVAETVQGRDPTAIADILDAMAWIADAPQLNDGLPDAETVTAALIEARRMAPLRRLVGGHFEGRKDILARMQAYLEAPDAEDVMFIHGPGGIGKSTVLAKFALDAAERDDLDAIAYLNLDRPILRPEEPLSLLSDLLSQLAQAFAGADDTLTDVRARVGDLERRLSYGGKDMSVPDASLTKIGDWERIVDDVAVAIAKLPGQRRILVLIDTFEQAQRQGEGVVAEMWRMAGILMRQAPRLRIIAAGRLEDNHFTDNRVALEAFERSDVERVLERACEASVPPGLVDEIYDLTGGHPLTVQLAAYFVAQVGAQAFADPGLRRDTLADLRQKNRDALLYGRILQQIDDPQVQRVALPAMILRRITPAAIREVLAGPCGLNLGPGQDHDLFARMAAEVDLMTPDHSDPETPALVHRADLRSLMLDDVRDDPKVPAQEIDARAVEHFSRLAGPHARAEELYHRIWRGDPEPELDRRWRPDAAPLLASALDELPPGRQPWLAARLGVVPTARAAEALDPIDRERTVAAQARRMLTRGDAEGVLSLLSERPERSPTSELMAIGAEAHIAMGDLAAGMEVLDRAIAAAEQAGATHRLAGHLLLRSQARERQRYFADASRDAAQALDIAERLDDQHDRLRALAALLRLGRKSRVVAGPPRATLRQRLHDLIDVGSGPDSARPLPGILYDNPDLTRELAAEIGEDHPELLQLSVQQISSVETPATDKVGSSFTREIMRLLIGLEKGDFGNVVEKVVGGDGGDAIRNLPRLIALARDRRVLDEVRKPLSLLLSADIDRQIGAFPSKSMIKRTTGVDLSDT